VSAITKEFLEEQARDLPNLEHIIATKGACLTDVTQEFVNNLYEFWMNFF
jgi:hypothetical protein